MAKKMKLRISARLLRKRARRGSDARLAKHCRFTSGEVPVSAIDYKNVTFLRNFLSERGKIIASRISGNAARYQRLVAREVKKARTMALLPYLALDRRVTTERTGTERGTNYRDRGDRGERGERSERGERGERRTSNVSQQQAAL
jgi:small subunit ribosomal protein S18